MKSITRRSISSLGGAPRTRPSVRLLLLSIAGTFSLPLLALNIAVIGAGPSGLTAAHYLRRAGHDVTLFEAAANVGGKVSTFTVDNTQIELGAVLITPQYRLIHQLKKTYGVESAVWPSQMMVVQTGDTLRPYKGYLGDVSFFGAMWQYVKLEKVFLDFPEIKRPALGPVGNPDLFLSLRDFAEKYGFQDILPPIAIALTVSGYSFPEEIPALYALRLMYLYKSSVVRSYIDAQINPIAHPLMTPLEYFPTGFTSLWQRMASTFEVRLNEPVRRLVKRPLGKIDVHTSKQTLTVDRVVVATNVRDAEKFISEDHTAFHELAKKIRTMRYLVTAFRTHQLPGGRSIFFENHLDHTKINRAMGLLHFFSSPKIHIAYQILDPHISWQTAQKILISDLKERLGVTDAEILLQKEWSYFPHLPTSELNNRTLTAMRDLQGQNGLYFVGGTWNFDSTENSARNAQHVCARYLSRDPWDVP